MRSASVLGRFAWLLAALALAPLGPLGALAGCGSFSAAPDTGGPDAGALDASPSDAAPAIAASCRELKAKLPAAASGMYALIGRTGEFYCDMDSFEGGWTLVRPDIVTEGRTQDVTLSSPNTVDVARTVDVHGGAAWEVIVTADDCNATGSTRALHWILVGELDAWRQIMGTYTFGEGAGCWNLFGDARNDEALPAMNVRVFDALLDTLDRDQNMARNTDGTAIPYDGRTQYCGPGLENFWHPDYRAQIRTARVVLRRELQQAPAGLFVSTSCGKPTWTLRDVFVR